MLVDPRQETLAHNLVTYSIDMKKGEKVLIEASGCDYQLVVCLVREVYKGGGLPFVSYEDKRIKRELLKNIKEEQLNMMAERDAAFMNQMDCYIGIRGGNNSYELSDIKDKNMQMYDKLYSIKVHHNIRVMKTKWVILRYPTEGMSQLAGQSTESFEDYFFDVCCVDYKKMSKAMDPLVKLMNKTDKVRIVAKDTDLTFSIKDIGAVKCAGKCNIPDGEVYTAPVKDSVNGKITYNTPSIENGFRFENVSLEFQDGKIVKISANDTKKATAIHTQ